MAFHKLPFSLSRRKNSRFYYVRFKDSEGEYLSAVSTKQSDYDEALKTAWQWYSSGQIPAGDKKESISKKSFLHELAKAEITESEAPKILELLQKRGILKSYVQPGAKNDIPLSDFLNDFWDWDKSEYIKERLRQGKKIGLSHCRRCLRYVQSFWIPFFKDRILGDMARQDLKDFLLHLQSLNRCSSGKNQIWLAGALPLRWASHNELIDRDITAGLTGFAVRNNKRAILTPEIVRALFAVEWEDERYKLANLLAMCTGLRLGEIRALRKCDLGKNCLYVSHSWNDLEGLKSTKNGEARVVQLPFPELSERLLQLAEWNPFDRSMEAFVFFATVPEKPVDQKGFLTALHSALAKVGLTETEARKYCFHSWRHFYASYMRDMVSEKLLQEQTGHKTLAMLEHYSEHKISGDDEKVQAAQKELFGAVVENSGISFDKARVYQNIKTGLTDKSGMYEHGRTERQKKDGQPQ